MMTATDNAERLGDFLVSSLWEVGAWKGTHIEDWTEKNMPRRSPKENCSDLDVDIVAVGWWSKESRNTLR